MDATILHAMFKSKSSHPLHRAIKAKREDVVFLYLIENDSKVLDVQCFCIAKSYISTNCTFVSSFTDR